MDRTTIGSIRRGLVFAISLSVMALGTPGVSWGHGEPPSLDTYGKFGPAAGCQRAISRATQMCFDIVTRLRTKCANRNLFGSSCEDARFNATVDAVVNKTRQLINDNCTDHDVHGILGFESLDDALNDAVDTCKAQAVAATSLLYGPAMFTGKIEGGPAPRDACLRMTSRYAFKVLRSSLRRRARALDLIASTDGMMSLADKKQLLADAEARTASLQQAAQNAIEVVCGSEFDGNYHTSMADFFSRLDGRADCLIGASHVQNEIECPAPVCGNGVQEPGEECDDGNTSGNDSCSTTCMKTSCDSFNSTYDLIQAAVFNGKGCTSQFCHDTTTKQGGLDLTAAHSYENLVDHIATADPRYKRVDPGNDQGSYLWFKLQGMGPNGESVGAQMPQGLAPLTSDEMEAMRLWIHAGAPRTGVVDGTANLLKACLPPSDPIQIRPPDPPAEGEGVQIKMPPNPLPPHSETEVCFASYYDVTDQVPQEFRGDNGTFRFKRKTETQDPLSHHLIIHYYKGEAAPDDPSWGPWTCKGGELDGQPCDPLNIGQCGAAGVCGSEPQKTAACLGYGPSDYSELTAPAFGGSQQTYATTKWPDGVYSELPLKGLIIWNSHAFNLTDRPAAVRAWVNLDFATPPEQQHKVLGGLLGVDHIFDMTSVPAFQKRTVCTTHVFSQGTHLFELSSHMHKHGKLFQIMNPQGTLIYSSTTYNDPVQLDFDPPLVLDSDIAADRSFKYCATYDNGFTDPTEVKRRSTSPMPPPGPFSFIGGPCAVSQTSCLGGPNQGTVCRGDDGVCGDGGVCDACPLSGGFTTEDEMFLLIGYYYCDPAYPQCKDDAANGFVPGS